MERIMVMGRTEGTVALKKKKYWQTHICKAFIYVMAVCWKGAFGGTNAEFFFFWTSIWMTGIGFASPSNCHCQAIRLHYGCAYAILINTPVVLPFLVTTWHPTGLTPSVNQQLRKFSTWQIFFFFLTNVPKQKCNHTFLNNCKNRMCYSALQLVVCINL